MNDHLQLDLFAHVASAYADSADGTLDNRQLYERVADKADLPSDQMNRKIPVGRAATPCSVLKRKIRWRQQDLRRLGIIERVEGERGIWRLTEAAGERLHRAARDVRLVAFSTDLGLAVWGSADSVFSRLGEPITLCLTSPPYPLRHPRAYGNPRENEYVDFVCRVLEPIVRHLVPGGSICLNISNDIFLEGSPARSLYREKLVIALCERFGLAKMDEFIWYNPSKPPGPVQWASKTRVQTHVAYEPVYWFTNDPGRVRADNRRVLEAHTERHLALIRRGGERRRASFGDGAYALRPGAFGAETAGRIPRNVLLRGHNCPDTRQYRRDAAALGLPMHGAKQPLSIPAFFINFLSEAEDLVVDPFAGACTTARAAEMLGRRWVVSEWMLEYVRAAAERFRPCAGFQLHPGLEVVGGFPEPPLFQI